MPDSYVDKLRAAAKAAMLKLYGRPVETQSMGLVPEKVMPVYNKANEVGMGIKARFPAAAAAAEKLGERVERTKAANSERAIKRPEKDIPTVVRAHDDGVLYAMEKLEKSPVQKALNKHFFDPAKATLPPEPAESPVIELSDDEVKQAMQMAAKRALQTKKK